MSEAYVCVMQVKYEESHAHLQMCNQIKISMTQSRNILFFPIFGVQLNARIEKNASS